MREAHILKEKVILFILKKKAPAAARAGSSRAQAAARHGTWQRSRIQVRVDASVL